jgi:hypothetical protein
MFLCPVFRLQLYELSVESSANFVKLFGAEICGHSNGQWLKCRCGNVVAVAVVVAAITLVCMVHFTFAW